MKDTFSDEPRKRSSSEDFSDRPSKRSTSRDDDGRDRTEGTGKLGSLAQAARSKKLKEARNLLLFIGILTIIVNGIFMGVELNDPKILGLDEHIILLVKLIYCVSIALGLVFVVLGLLVNRFPVPVTILSLVLYLAAMFGFAIFNWATLLQGVIFKIIVIVALAKAIQAALAYEKEERRRSMVEFEDY